MAAMAFRGVLVNNGGSNLQRENRYASPAPLNACHPIVNGEEKRNSLDC